MLNNNFSLQFKKSDLIVILSSVLIAIGLIIGILTVNGGLSSNCKYINIYHRNQRISDYSYDIKTLTEPTTIVLTKEKYPHLIADFTIEVNPNKGVRVKEVDCYDNTCINQGWVNIINLPIVCTPNDVRIVLTNTLKSSGDDVIGGIYYEKIHLY